ncbi:hypothetical protein [Yersinia intermedia]|uniref:hypothetical protein n=1 Tax=Yersinia intermedia TaxID=631 RepID=UPI0039C72395
MLLLIRVTYRDSAIGYCRMSSGTGITTITESGITGVEQLEVTAAPGVIRLQRRGAGGFTA